MNLIRYVMSERDAALEILLSAQSPTLTFDPYGGLWSLLEYHPDRHNIAISCLQPGHFNLSGQGGWDLLADLKNIGGDLSVKVNIVVNALMLTNDPNDKCEIPLAREIMVRILQFAVETGWFRDFPELCHWLVSGSIRHLISFFHCRYRENTHVAWLSSQNASLIEWQAAEEVLKETLHIFRDPLVAWHLSRPGLSLSTFSDNPRQALFLAPGVVDTMNGNMMMLYQFLFHALAGLAELNDSSFQCLMQEVILPDGTRSQYIKI